MKYTTKDGTVKEYDQKKYNANYRERNKERLSEPYHCLLCNRIVMMTHREQHERTKRHKRLTGGDQGFPLPPPSQEANPEE